ncbi:hypothetical protein SERLADRAFT_406467 [Serpula lacrymans var. lacrymans S7.9]|uniref:Uncharacterized protein n=1 Tax=Serpula lacrymans var. lacrymans (strain S7.9) TaxID=578457 RepID=F8NM85_SERL9|nr:uncharacterized protein SERLADRAFT_406467 [Serpula lacrymans var. lacrymans S7.9]EGO27335.1 hypothetical protein SERLADRAFT_406467 [Serpula lacrymans var. lacrymans S7.9]
MDTDLKCNRLTCRKALADKAVVALTSSAWTAQTSCLMHHDFVQHFTLKFTYEACETSLTEPDDVVPVSFVWVKPFHNIRNMQPSDVVLAIPNPSREASDLCSLSMYTDHLRSLPSSFQQALTRGMNDKNAQLQKQLENVIREANGEINLLSNKVAEMERDLELERRKVHELQEVSRERDKEYQKLKVYRQHISILLTKAQHDKIKRKALLGPSGQNLQSSFGYNASNTFERSISDDQNKVRSGQNANISIGAVVGGMEANGIQRTPLVHRHSTGGPFAPSHNAAWAQPQQVQMRNQHQRQPFGLADQPYHTNSVSDRSESANEVENMLMSRGRPTSMVQPDNRHQNATAWASSSSKPRPVQQRYNFDPNKNYVQ